MIQFLFTEIIKDLFRWPRILFFTKRRNTSIFVIIIFVRLLQMVTSCYAIYRQNKCWQMLWQRHWPRFHSMGSEMNQWVWNLGCNLLLHTLEQTVSSNKFHCQKETWIVLSLSTGVQYNLFFKCLDYYVCFSWLRILLISHKWEWINLNTNIKSLFNFISNPALAVQVKSNSKFFLLCLNLLSFGQWQLALSLRSGVRFHKVVWCQLCAISWLMMLVNWRSTNTFGCCLVFVMFTADVWNRFSVLLICRWSNYPQPWQDVWESIFIWPFSLTLLYFLNGTNNC